MHCKWTELWEQMRLNKKYKMCSGNRGSNKLAGTQGTYKGLVKENWKSRLRHREFCAGGVFGASFTGGRGAIKSLKVRE